jgi:predicted AAA+ superfamily ATPase
LQVKLADFKEKLEKGCFFLENCKSNLQISRKTMWRPYYQQQIQQAFAIHPIVGLLGPRQCGKTTLARQYIQDKFQQLPHPNYFDLEDAEDIARLKHPQRALSQLSGLIVIDEVQYMPELFPSLRVLVDRHPEQHYLILGSASRDLLQQSSESLAGRIEYIELTPFTAFEVDNLSQLWLRGGFPKAYLAENEQQSARWCKAYIKTFLERDIPNLGINIAAAKLRRFWMMLTHYHGNIFNASEIGKSLGFSHTTAQEYLDILSGTFMIRELSPWYENITKRQVKSKKIYFRDSGILHSLLNIEDQAQLLVHPKLGASWEGFALEAVIQYYAKPAEECFFWATHAQAELDLLLFIDGKKVGFEFKYADAPKMSKSMHIACEDLALDELHVIYPGQQQYALADNVDVIGLSQFITQQHTTRL